jgi:ribose 5-phosphate isomerase B
MDSTLKIAIGGDHAGFELKTKIKSFLESRGFSVKDFGTHSADSVDYPDYVHPLAMAIETGQFDLGILMCGSGNGVCMTANKHNKVRAALTWNEELAALARQHNNANVLCLPARFVDTEAAEKMVDVFLKSEFEGGRHERRVNKINC